MIDPVVAIVTLLESDAGVSALASTHVYGEELPAAAAALMPRAAVVVRSAGGPIPEVQRAATPRVDIRCYGATPASARTVAGAVYDVLAYRGRTDVANSRIYTALPDTEPIASRDPDTGWPSVTQPYLITIARDAVA